ncbi:ferrous iron transporter B [Luteococcus sp. OSA5]|uniref:ferrous iron transporter B n=1 Tax=Luteococcus sp. OSA5 TaxID=3401630 RepID=UPI003B433464
MTCHDAGATLTAEHTTTRRICLLGNPNAGKSTLFNALTGLKAKVANYPGITVSKMVGELNVDGQQMMLEDLPGTYSLDAISPDEQVTTEAVTGDDHPDALVVVLDATSLRRSLGLLAQAQHTGVPILVVLSFCDELARRGGYLDAAALGRALGNTVVIATAGDRRQLTDVKHALAAPELWDTPELAAPTDPALVQAWVDSVLREADYRAPDSDARTRRIDSVLLHPLWGTLIFFATMYAFFQVIFTVAAPIQGWIEDGFAWLSELSAAHIETPWLQGLVADGLIGGVGGVLVFLPQIALLFLMISLLEASGYMSRVAFLMDRVMGKAGLEGRAFVAMLSSVACAIPGIMATRSLPSAKDRLATMLSAPLMTCSARLPVYTMLIAMLVPQEAKVGTFGLQGTLMFAMYLLGAVVAMIAAWVAKRLLGRRGTNLPFFMEMPSYRRPHLRDVIGGVWNPVKSFLMKIGRVILVLTLVLWALLNLPVASQDRMAEAGIDTTDEAAVATYQLDNSYAASMGKAIQPVFEPLGFDWRITVGVTASLGAREVFVATLGQIASADDPEDPAAALEKMTWTEGPHAGEKLFTPATLAALLVFFAFALQCTATIAVLRRESGSWKWPAIAFGYMFVLAWGSAWLVRTLVELAG